MIFRGKIFFFFLLKLIKYLNVVFFKEFIKIELKVKKYDFIYIFGKIILILYSFKDSVIL